MRKLSELTSTQWRERIGISRMKPAPQPLTEKERVSLGENRNAIRTRDHAAIVYWHAEELLDTVVPYLKEGLRAGDKVVYVADDLVVERIAAALSAAGVDVDAAQKSGKLMLVSANDAFFQGGKFDVEAALQGVRALAEQANADGFPRVRFSVEMTYLLANVPGIERGPEFEARANEEVFAKFPFVCICSFNGARDVNNMLAEVLATHPVLISNGIPLTNPYYRPWPELASEKATVKLRAVPPPQEKS
ncbi:MAG: MEDS domain-containing protein [Myxococcaceae bacterium]